MRPLASSWEQRKLGEIAPVTMGQSPNGACYTDNPNDVVLVQGNADLKDGWVSPRVWTTEITKTAKSGDLIMSVRAPVGAMGKTAYDVVLGRGVAGIVGNEFLFQALSKKEAEGYWSTVSAGSTFDSINGDELRSTPIDCPRSETECEAIGNCLFKVDYLITLHQRKYDKLCAVKKSMLDKMFPKSGETEPEIRFAGFTDPWEQRKFSELASLRRGLTYSPVDIRPYGQGIRVLRSSNIDEDEFTLSNEDVFVDETVVGIELVQEGEILITAANGSPRLVGKRAIIDGLTGKTVHGGFMLCAHAEQPDYVAALMGSRWYQHFLATGVAGGNGSIGNLDKAALEDEYAFVPSIKEQELIGALFSRLSDLITLHQRKLNLLKNTKKSLLDRMFV